jgi:tRNA (guanine-N7-)-methyltransferase
MAAEDGCPAIRGQCPDVPRAPLATGVFGAKESFEFHQRAGYANLAPVAMNSALTPSTSVLPVSYLHPLTSLTERLDWAVVFSSAQPVEVDLGCGDAAFLLEYAAQHPERNFLGVERLLGRLRKLERRARRARLANARGLRVECIYAVQYLMPPESVAAFHVYFPDPWPKKRHHKNRMVNAAFPALMQQALVPGGVVCLRTDHEDYFAQMLEVFGAHAGFRAVATPDELASVRTDFEKEFSAQGILTRRAAFQKWLEPELRSNGRRTVVGQASCLSS